MLAKRIKVLHIITHLDLGGAQKVSLALIKSLNRELFEIYFVSSSRGRLLNNLRNISGVKFNIISTFKREINPALDLITLFKLFKYIRNNKIDIVHTHSPKAGILGRWAARLAGTPVIIHTIHGFPFFNTQNILIKKIYILLESITACITHKLITVCKSDIEKGLFHGIGTPDKYILIREGAVIDETAIKDTQKKRTELNLADNSPVISMVGCLKNQKAPLDFIKAARLIKESNPLIKFILVGDGPLRKQVEKLCRKLKLVNNLLILGWREDVLSIVSLTDIVVLTSCWEGLPISLLEAMYLGKPIVATNVDGIKELIRNEENGFLVEPGNFRLLADRVTELLSNKKLADSFVTKSRSEIIPDFDISKTISQTERLYLNLAGSINYAN